MTTPIGIGDFARMTFLSVKALRHYHEVGLLTPAVIDPASGYRRYDLSQVATAQVIRRLRDLDMPLVEIQHVITASDVSARNAAIVAHLHRMEHELARTQATIAALRQLLEQPPATRPVTYRTIGATETIAIQARLTGSTVLAWRRTAFQELRAVLATTGLRRTGPDGALFSGEILEDEYGMVTAFIPVAGTATLKEHVQRLTLPATEYATALHQGSAVTLDQTFAALGAVVTTRMISVAGPIREHYLIGDLETADVQAHETEVLWPVFLAVPGESSL